jgi:hypothetical protein
MDGMTDEEQGGGGVVTDGGEGTPDQPPPEPVNETEFVARNWFEDDNSLQSFEFIRTAATDFGQLQDQVEEFLGHEVEMSGHGVEPGQDPSEETPLTIYIALPKTVEVDEAGLRQVVDEHVPVPRADPGTPILPDGPSGPDTATQNALDKLNSGNTLSTAELSLVLKYALSR